MAVRRTVALLLVTATAVLAGVLLKQPCVTGAWVDGFQYKRLCYNDLQPLYFARHLDEKRVPYVEEFLEYPALTGTEMYLTALPSRSDASFFAWNAVVLGLCALAGTAALSAATGAAPRVLMFAAAPSLVLYAVHNWELLAVAPLAAGLWLWGRRRWGWAGAAFGLGAAAKLFPAAALVTGLVVLLRDGRRRDAAVFVGAFTGVVGAFNLPYALANPGLWLETWTFHAHRFPDFGTPWYWLWKAGGEPEFLGFQHLVDRLGLVTLMVATAIVVLLQLRRHLPMTAATAALVAAFLVVSKVHSPQYALWLLPFFVLLPRSWPYFALCEAVGTLVFVSGFLWLAGWPGRSPAPNRWQHVFMVAVLARAAVLLATALHFARTAGSPSEALDGRGGEDVFMGLSAEATLAGHRS